MAQESESDGSSGWAAAGAIICLIIVWLVGALRWKWILEALGVRFGFAFLLQTWIAADFFSRALPMLTPIPPLGAAYRVAQTARTSREVLRPVVAIVVEKVLGLAAFWFSAILVSVPWLALQDEVRVPRAQLALAAIGIAVIGAIPLLLILRPQVLARGAQLFLSPDAIVRSAPALEAFVAVGRNPRRVFQIISAGVLMQLATAVYLACTFSLLTGVDLGDGFGLSILSNLSLVPGHLDAYWPQLGAVGVFFVVLLLAGMLGAAFVIWQLFLIACGKEERVDVGVLDTRFDTRQLDIDAILESRRRILGVASTATMFGVLAGGLIGSAEALWIVRQMVVTDELRILWWGPLVYGLLLWPCGLVAGGLHLFVGAAWGRRATPGAVGATALGGTIGIGIVVFGRFRYARDVLAEEAMSAIDIVALLLIALVVAGAATGGVRVLARRLTPKTLILGAGAVYVGLVAAGAGLDALWADPRGSGEVAPEPGLEARNVVLVVADALRADYLSLYSAEALAGTPALEAFASDAVVFEESFAQAPWTKPTFASMFTGLYPSEHRAIGKASSLSEDAVPIAEILLEAGYYTQGFPNNPNIAPGYGFGRGFVEYRSLGRKRPFLGTRTVQRLSLYDVLRKTRSRMLLPRIDVYGHYHPAPEVNATAEAWLENEAPEDTPFFLFLHYMDPHDPYMKEDTFPQGYSMLNLGLTPDPEKYGEAMRSAYNVEIERMDRFFGMLMEDLKERGLYDDSLIVFTADHGEEFYDHGGFWHGMTHYDEMLRVPLMMKLPGNQEGGERTAAYASQVDLAPTILEVLGIESTAVMSGTPLVDAAGRVLNSGPRFVFAESNFVGARIESLRQDETKIIRSQPGPQRPLPALELFDLREDPAEQANLAGAGHPREADLDARLKEILALLRPWL